MIYLAYLALLFAYVLLAGVALAACGREPPLPPNGPNCCCQLVDHDVCVEISSVSPLDSYKNVCGLTRRETRLYDDDVYQIVVWDSRGHEYSFIFTLDRTAGVLLTAASFAKNNEFGFNTRSLLTVALGIDLLLKQRK